MAQKCLVYLPCTDGCGGFQENYPGDGESRWKRPLRGEEMHCDVGGSRQTQIVG